jgi:hypothetical protein
MAACIRTGSILGAIGLRTSVRSNEASRRGGLKNKYCSQDLVETRLPLMDPFSSCTVSYKLPSWTNHLRYNIFHGNGADGWSR